MQLVPSTLHDGPAIRQLIQAAGLPTDDLTPELVSGFLLHKDGERIVATGAVERLGTVGLLRSVAVLEALRGSGVGGRMVEALEARARADGIRNLYLLTTTADGYFARLGYRAVAREQAPPEIRATAQFSALCPSSSTLMVKSMTQQPFNVLFLCTGNSARSILSEFTLNHLAAGSGRFHSYSAGSFPKGQPNPLALGLLKSEGISTEGARSKSWDEFSAPGAPPIHLVVTVCDQAAGEQCPYYPGKPLKAHWGVPDPHTEAEFQSAYQVLRGRIERLIELPVETMDRTELHSRLLQIGGE